MKTSTRTVRTDYLKQTSHQLDLWGEQFATLEENVKRSSTQGQARLQDELHSLRKKKRALKRRLREAAHAGTEVAWEDVRGELEDAVGDFRALATKLHQRVEGAQS